MTDDVMDRIREMCLQGIPEREVAKAVRVTPGQVKYVMYSWRKKHGQDETSDEIADEIGDEIGDDADENTIVDGERLADRIERLAWGIQSGEIVIRQEQWTKG